MLYGEVGKFEAGESKFVLEVADKLGDGSGITPRNAGRSKICRCGLSTGDTGELLLPDLASPCIEPVLVYCSGDEVVLESVRV